MFELAKEYHKDGWVVNLVLKQDGTLSGTVLVGDEYYARCVGDGDFARHMAEQPPEDHHATISLDTGRWHCSCPYSQVDICSHVAALLICAAKDMRATVPADDLPMHPRSMQRTTLPYRDEAYRILTQSDSVESANEDLNEFLELAVACSN